MQKELFPEERKSPPTGKILVGTSGFSYDDWVGPFYPPGTRKSDMLTVYSRHFPTVEINFTYYRLPPPSTMSSLVKKSEGSVIFAVKLNKDITHTRDEVADDLFRKFLAGIEPMRQAGVLGALLAQYPWQFKNFAENWRRLEQVRRMLPDDDVVVEFRHDSWAEPAVEEGLRELGLGFCIVDEPQMSKLMPMRLWRTSDVAYLRFHGRNYKKWFKHDHPSERYDYLYKKEELEEWVPRIKGLASDAKKVYVFMNNHPIGQAIVNARMLMDMLFSDLNE